MVKFYKEVTTQQLTAIKCDKCNKVYHSEEEEMRDGMTVITDLKDTFEIEEFHHINFTGGYESVFGDQNKVECDLCQHCLKELIGEYCKITER